MASTRRKSKSTFERTTFSINRELEFFTEKELDMQIGHPRDWWPIALTKELIDNGLDAAETILVPPHLEVHVDAHGLSVQDNGPGIPTRTIDASLDYLVRASDKAFYVSPTRGQLGNALKCLWAAPFVVDGERSVIEVSADSIRHRIEVCLDRIAGKTRVQRIPEPSLVKTGTLIRMPWPNVAKAT